MHQSGLIQPFTALSAAWILATWLLVPGEVSATPDPNGWATGVAFEEQLAGTVDIFWADLPFRQAIESLSRARRVAILLDRRVDPSQKVNLTAGGMPMEAALRAVARRRHLEVARLSNVIYFGPQEACHRLAAVSRALSVELRRLEPTVQKKGQLPRKLAWNDLATPRELLQGIGAEVGLKIEGIEHVPHDLFAAADLPPLSLADRLTLIGIQYDVTFKAAGSDALIIVPLAELPSTTVVATPQKELVTRHPKPQKSRSAGGIDQIRIDRISVQEKPLKPVLQQLAERLKLDLRWDERAIAAAGIPVDRRVTLQIENATVDELLTSLLKGTGLTYQRKQRVVEIRPVDRLPPADR